MKEHILIADDEKEILSLLRLYLENAGYQVSEASDGETAYTLIQTGGIDLAILDVMMPKLDGYALIRRIRAHSDLPIIVLSARSETTDKIMGLGLGADDYIAKPFDGLEVIARVEACLRRLSRTKVSPSPAPSLLTVRDLTLDTSACVLIKDGTSIELTSIEYRILKLFMESPGRVFTKKQIYETAWGDDYVVDDNNIMVYISKIREKLGERSGASYIRTIRGLGYKLLP
ncbi:MAG TPA: response regulator transcription factor [Candidatus Mediterraneibacter excrementigallinarum]|nr:response regulator transcription factor [Candidatus Mediterraneibacter excrementigallinarum]